MPEQARITFYTVNNCGYYRRRQTAPQFGALSDTLTHLLRWVDPGRKPLEETSTYTPNENSEGALRTFCVGMHRNAQGEFLLITWNELSNHDGAVASIDVSEPVGTAVPTMREFDRNLVPGFPAYFWFIPDRNLVVNVRFDTERLSGTRGMNLYMQGFLNHFSPHVVLGESTEDAEHNVIGYAPDARSETVPVNPRFHCVQRHRPQHIQSLRGRRLHIRKIIRKAVLAPTTAVERRGLAAFFQMLGVVDIPDALPTIRSKAELDFTPSAPQFDQMVANWNDHPEDDWQDIGFKFHGENKIEWLSAGAARFSYELDVDRGEQGFVAARELLTALSARRTHILALIA
jgi:hypothetical protein